MSESLGVPVHDEDWPHGLRCADCERPLGEGDRYSERFTSLTDDGIPVVTIVCVGCALTPESESA